MRWHATAWSVGAPLLQSSSDRDAGNIQMQLRCRRTLIGLVLIPAEKNRRIHRYLKWIWFCSVTVVLLVLKIGLLQPSIHSVLMFLKKITTSRVWFLSEGDSGSIEVSAPRRSIYYVSMTEKRDEPYLSVTERERVFGMDEGPSSQNRALRPIQRGVVWKKHVIRKATSVRQIVVHSCKGTFAAARACMLLLRQFHFAGGRDLHRLLQRIITWDCGDLLDKSLTSSWTLSVRRMCRLQKRSCCLLLIISVLDRRKYDGITAAVCVLQSLFLPGLHTTSRKASKNPGVWMGKAFPLSQWSEKGEGGPTQWMWTRCCP